MPDDAQCCTSKLISARRASEPVWLRTNVCGGIDAHHLHDARPTLGQRANDEIGDDFLPCLEAIAKVGRNRASPGAWQPPLVQAMNA